MEDEAEAPQEEPSMLQKIRNMWEFASLMQYIFFFGKAVKIEEVEVEVCCQSIIATPKLLGIVIILRMRWSWLLISSASNP